MITKATKNDISQLNTLINSAYLGESSKKGWTTEANILERLRTNEKEHLENVLKIIHFFDYYLKRYPAYFITVFHIRS